MEQVYWKEIASKVFWAFMFVLGLFPLAVLLNYAGAFGVIF